MGMNFETEDGTGRRAFLARGLLAGAALSLARTPDGQPLDPARPPRVRHAARVPPTMLNLAAFGGLPGAGRAALADAFDRALAALTRKGGGTLLVPPGVYDVGRLDGPDTLFVCRGLRDIAISAYGATFVATTTTTCVPNMFYFYNFDNVTLAGASFTDHGFVPWVDWRGMYCVGIQADRPSSGFHLVDCFAERVVGLLASNNAAAGRQWLSDIHVEGEVREAYYGVGANYVARNVDVDLDCHNVRRAFIAYAARHADITVRASADSGWPGSNGLIALVCAGASLGNVENVRVRVDVSGSCIHGSYVHFYHQGPQPDGVIRDVDATVNLSGMHAMRCMYLFDHETDGVQRTTGRRWDRIVLHGSMAADCDGTVVASTSRSTAPGTVFVDRALARSARLDRLAAGFRLQPS